MKPRLRPISNLYFRFGGGSDLQFSQIAKALSEVGIIKLVGLDHYYDVENVPKLDAAEYERKIRNALKKANGYV